MGQTVCLGRFHDGTAKPNWGGRATSLALARTIRLRGHEVTSVLNGELIVNGFEDDGDAASTDPPGWDGVRSRAAELLQRRRRSPRLTQVLDSLDAADEFWMNGEGDFILTTRPTLWRSLVLMTLAAELGRRVVLVNSMLSEPAGAQVDPAVAAAVGDVLALCDSVQYRDPTSLELHRALYPGVPATWSPDALFTWAAEGAQLAAAPVGSAHGGPYLEGVSPEVQSMLTSGRPYVAVSGSSAPAGDDRTDAIERLELLLRGLQARDLEPVVVATGNGDRWMRRAAKLTGCGFLGPGVPLVTGSFVLAHARCVVSGRYHPSVLAATAGTPVVLMASNSHKTSSLQLVLGRAEPDEFPFLPRSAELERLLDAVGSAAEGAESSRSSGQARARELADRCVRGR